MSDFSDSWIKCMRSHDLPVPVVEDLHEALELLDKLNQALENAGGEAEITIGVLLGALALIGVDEAALVVLGQVAEIAAAAYLGACITCLGIVAIDDLRSLFASNEVPDFVVAELHDGGIELSTEVIA